MRVVAVHYGVDHIQSGEHGAGVDRGVGIVEYVERAHPVAAAHHPVLIDGGAGVGQVPDPLEMSCIPAIIQTIL